MSPSPANNSTNSPLNYLYPSLLCQHLCLTHQPCPALLNPQANSTIHHSFTFLTCGSWSPLAQTPKPSQRLVLHLQERVLPLSLAPFTLPFKCRNHSLHCPLWKFQMQWGGTVQLRLWCASRSSIRGKPASVWMDKLEVRIRGVLVWWRSQPGSWTDSLIITLKRHVPHPQSNGTGPNNSNVVAGSVFGEEKNTAVICRISYLLFIIFLPEKQHLSQAKKKLTITHHVYFLLLLCCCNYCLEKNPSNNHLSKNSIPPCEWELDRVCWWRLYHCVILSEKLNRVTFQDVWWVRISIIT